MSLRPSWRRHLTGLGIILVILVLIGIAGSLPLKASTPQTIKGDTGQSLAMPQLLPTPSGGSSDTQRQLGYAPVFVEPNLKGQWRPALLAQPLLTRKDWRADGKVTRVQNQNPCGTCWDFAGLANFESELLIRGEGTFDFSENSMMNCIWSVRNTSRDGCMSGGTFWDVLHHLSSYGAVLEACDPWVPANGTCKTSCVPVKSVKEGWILAGTDVPPVDTLKGWLQQYGPLWVTIDAGADAAWKQEFSNYNGSYVLYHPGYTQLNHAVLLVGWDDSKSSQGGSGAWIVKNSWGTNWGGTCDWGNERGFFYIAYGSAGIGTNASAIRDWQNYSPSVTLLHNDESFRGGFFGWQNTHEAWGLSKLTPNQNGCATSVEFFTGDATTNVEIYIYDNFNGSSASGLLWQSAGLHFDYPGYHSVAIVPPLQLQAGNGVSVKIRFGNARSQYAVPVDTEGPAAPGVSYMSQTGQDGTWYDMGTGPGGNPPMDVAIRLRVGPCQAEATPTVTRSNTPVHTATATPTLSPTRTRTPGPSPTPGNNRNYLPLMMRPLVQPTPTRTFTPRASATATRQPSATPTTEAGYFDDFSNPASGWYVGENASTRVGYLSGEYQILIKRSLYWQAASAPNVYMTDGAIDVDARFAQTLIGAYGIIFGLDNSWSNMYMFVVGGGEYSLYYNTGIPTTLIDWTGSPYLNPDTATNHLRVERNGAEIVLLANGYELARITDSSSMGSLRVGLVAMSYGSSYEDARFDNFRVTPFGAGSPLQTTGRDGVATSGGMLPLKAPKP